MPGILFYRLAGLGLNARDVFYKRPAQLTKWEIWLFHEIGEHDESFIISFSSLFTIP